MNTQTTPTIEELHREACLRGESTYKDPTSGALVFTESYHRERGSCCRSGCRHCPYGFQATGFQATKRGTS